MVFDKEKKHHLRNTKNRNIEKQTFFKISNIKLAIFQLQFQFLILEFHKLLFKVYNYNLELDNKIKN